MKNKWMKFEEVKELARSEGIRSQSQWFKWCKSEFRPSNVPSGVVRVYSEKWISWYDFLGNKPKNFLSYSDLVLLMRKFNIKSEKEYYELDREKYDLPRNPEQVYKEWNNWSDFLGKDKRDKGRKHRLNHEFFKKWSYDMAYILGLLFADGSINSSSIRITLHKNDSYLLDNIFKAVGSNAKITFNKKRNCCSLVINSVDMSKDVLKIFKKERKSSRKEFPKIPKKYFSDFVRGFWDGDGSIWYDKHGHSYRSSLVCSSFSILSCFHKKIKENIFGISGSISRTVQLKGTKVIGHPLKKDSVVYRLVFRPNDTRRLRDFIYSSSCNLRLNRKYKKFLDAGSIYLAPKDRRKSYWKFEKSRRYVRKLRLNSLKEWRAYCVCGQKPQFIPSVPGRIYKEWEGHRDWLGK